MSAIDTFKRAMKRLEKRAQRRGLLAAHATLVLHRRQETHPEARSCSDRLRPLAELAQMEREDSASAAHRHGRSRARREAQQAWLYERAAEAVAKLAA